MALALTYPARASTNELKFAYALRMKEHLRMLHNILGLWFRVGITQDEYDNGIEGTKLSGVEVKKFQLPESTKLAQPYKAKLLVDKEAEIDEYHPLLESEWERRHRLANTDLGQLQEALQIDPDFDADVNLDDI